MVNWNEESSPDVEELAALLQGGRSPPPNRLSRSQLQALSAFCDALIPSAEAPRDAVGDEALARFYGTSASMAGVAEQVAGLVCKERLHPALPLLRLALWLLSTRYGTLLLCGTGGLTANLPFFHKFSDLDELRREKIPFKLSRSCFGLKRLLFRALQLATVRLYFQAVDEKNRNPSWAAIGYCGSDPDRPPAESQQSDDPLLRAVMDMSSIPRNPPLLRPFTPDPSSPLALYCDVVVVGSGSGGSVVAGVLATAGYRVVVLEKGRYFPAASLSLLEGPSNEQMYEKGGMLSSDDLSLLFLAGSTVGGGSAINWSASFRTPDSVLEEWHRAHGLSLFGDPAYQRALDAVCERMKVHPSTTAGTPAEGMNSAVLRRGCSALGYDVKAIPVNAPDGHDCGWCHLGCKDRKKQSTPETWLADMAASGNGVVLAGCDAVRVTTARNGAAGRKKTATGVIARFSDGEITVRAKVTVVACGALNTPGLLRRSGLRNPNIGRHLHLHPAVIAWGYFPEETDWLDRDKKSFTGELLTAMAPVPGDGADGASAALIQTPAMHPGAFSAVTPWTSAADFRRRMARFSRTATLFALTRDRGSGSAARYPDSVSYALDEGDERALQRGTERMLRVLAAAGAEEVGTNHRDGGAFRAKGASREEWEAFVRRESGRGLRKGETPICSAHQMGSCRMGTSAKTSVVNPQAETWEVERLFLADTSVFPTALGVNPMVTVQAIAYCTAQNILQVLQPTLAPFPT
ncbi:long-chain-alcohol oxidase FAO4A-like [Wolffia australiana]